MSAWTYITGVVAVSPLGRSQEEIEYILKTVVRHLPKVTGSERDMFVHVVKSDGANVYSNYDELGHPCDFEYQDTYLLVLEANLRDRFIEQTKQEFFKWLTRLAKRVLVMSGTISIIGRNSITFDQETVNLSFNIVCDDNRWYDLFERPSWANKSEGEPTWSEYLMWDSMRSDSDTPVLLGYKYYEDKKNDEEAERRIKYNKRN